MAIVGCAGAIGVRSIAWWEGAVTWASFEHRYGEHGGGSIAGPTWDRDEIPPYGQTGEVDTIDGFMIAMSPWAVRELRFDEGLGQFHGYDFDICLQARSAGKKVVTQDIKVIHHHSLDLIGDLGGWIDAHMKIAEKWEGRVAGVGEAAGDWKQRARRAEAEADAARMLANAPSSSATPPRTGSRRSRAARAGGSPPAALAEAAVQARPLRRRRSVESRRPGGGPTRSLSSSWSRSRRAIRCQIRFSSSR